MSSQIVVVRTPATAHGENTSDRARLRPTKVSLMTRARPSPSTSWSPTSTTTHWAVNRSESQNSWSLSRFWKFCRPMNPLLRGLVTLYLNSE